MKSFFSLAMIFLLSITYRGCSAPPTDKAELPSFSYEEELLEYLLSNGLNENEANSIIVSYFEGRKKIEESGLIRQINPPAYLGAIVVCQGADNNTVRLAIVEAVSRATGLGADKISVLKMR